MSFHNDLHKSYLSYRYLVPTLKQAYTIFTKKKDCDAIINGMTTEIKTDFKSHLTWNVIFEIGRRKETSCLISTTTLNERLIYILFAEGKAVLYNAPARKVFERLNRKRVIWAWDWKASICVMEKVHRMTELFQE